MTAGHQRTLALALHEVEPATLERCVQIRQWLSERGIDRATLLVIPARDLHPLAGRSPDVAGWLLERKRSGDSIAQHGFQHPTGSGRRIGLRTGSGEFARMDAQETRRAVEAGWRVLKLAGIEPDGFIAPGYAYTPALRQALRRRFRWWAELLSVHRVELAPHSCALPAIPTVPGSDVGDLAAHLPAVRHKIMTPPVAPASPSGLRRSLSRALVRVEAQLELLAPQATLRLDLHPQDFDRPSRVGALERLLLALVEDRRAITYDELARSPLSRPTGAPIRQVRIDSTRQAQPLAGP